MKLLLALLLAAIGFAADIAKPAFSSAKYDKDIAAYESADKATPPPQGALLLSGASTLRLWKTAARDFAPYPLINRGFGGSKTTEVLGYMDRIVLPYHPRVVIFHCGSNDINAGDTAEAVVARVTEYHRRLRAENPHAQLVLLSTTQAPSRRTKWAEMKKADEGFRALAAAHPEVRFVDINPALNLPNGEGKPGSYLKDNLHPDVEGYKAIASVLKPAVDAAWQATEAAYKK
jgi:lysophospholipase L1-like esterase